MGKIFQKYRQLSFERKTILKTTAAMCFSAVLAGGKLVTGIFYDYNLIIIATYTFALLLAKLECVKGAKASGADFDKQTVPAAVFMLFSSAVYTVFMAISLSMGHAAKKHSLVYVVLLAFISFSELVAAVAGIFRTKNSGRFYRDIKIISFCMALIAVMTTQVAILDYMSAENAYKYNAFTGMGVGAVIAACAALILVSPKISVEGREHNVFMLSNGSKNKLIPEGAFELVLCKSAVYGSYVYRAVFSDGRLEGDIVRTPSLWERMNIFFKIICCILSEILVFLWLLGRAVLLFRSANMPARLEKMMNENGFKKCRA